MWQTGLGAPSCPHGGQPGGKAGGAQPLAAVVSRGQLCWASRLPHQGPVAAELVMAGPQMVDSCAHRPSAHSCAGVAHVSIQVWGLGAPGMTSPGRLGGQQEAGCGQLSEGTRASGCPIRGGAPGRRQLCTAELAKEAGWSVGQARLLPCVLGWPPRRVGRQRHQKWSRGTRPAVREAPLPSGGSGASPSTLQAGCVLPR